MIGANLSRIPLDFSQYFISTYCDCDHGDLQWLYHLWLRDDGGDDDDGGGDDGDGGDDGVVLAVLAGAAGPLLTLLLPLLMLPLPLLLWRKCCFDKIYYWMMSLDRDRSCIVRKGGR